MEVIEVLVSVGQLVADGDALLVLEPDKVEVEVPCVGDGSVAAVLVEVDAAVRTGDPIMKVEG